MARFIVIFHTDNTNTPYDNSNVFLITDGFCPVKYIKEPPLLLTTLSIKFQPAFSSVLTQYGLISLETGLSLQKKNTFYSLLGSDAITENIDFV